MNMNEFLSAKCEFAKTLLSRINLFRHGIVIAGGAVSQGIPHEMIMLMVMGKCRRWGPRFDVFVFQGPDA